MPEGHSIHRLARRHLRLLQDREVRASSPQGRFAEGAALLDGRRLLGTDAHGKHLFHDYGEDRWLHVHLGLYGRFTDGTAPAAEPRGALRLRLLSDDHWLDLRGPITCEVVTAAERAVVTARLGPDPLREGSDPAPLLARLGRSRSPVGTLLMDQRVVAGIGNVYRAEVLFRHGVSPFLPARELDPRVAQEMWDDLRVLMDAGVRAGRIVTTRPEERERPEGRARRVDATYAYRRTGLPCRVCGTPVASAELAARNVFWCPTCQPAPG